jgi:hypothetical protein
MPNPEYLTTCPNCGVEMTPHAGYPDSAPWLCAHCHRGFFVAELSPAARQAYRPLFHDWGMGAEGRAIREAVQQELTEARWRGTSARVEHLGFLESGHLEQLHRLPLSADMREQVTAAQKTR